MEKIRLVDEGRVPRFFCNLLKHSIQLFYNRFKHVHGTYELKTRLIKKKCWRRFRRERENNEPIDAPESWVFVVMIPCVPVPLSTRCVSISKMYKK